MSKNRTIAFHTLGCKLNFSESSSIARKLEEKGYQKTDFGGVADIYVINTCSVTENADKECKYLVRKAKERAPESKVVIIGCFAQLKPESIAKMQGVDMVLGAKEKFNLENFIPKLYEEQEPIISSCEIEEVASFKTAYSFGDRTRSFLKVQDGCDYNCSFCTIPLARGKSRSDTVASVVQAAHHIAEKGIKEVVLTGVNIGDFGKHSEILDNKERFLDLIQALDEVEGIERFRISSIEPNLLTNEIIEFVAQSKRFMPHFHIPLQSGSDPVLKRMRRRYLSDLYQDRVEKIKSLMPDCCIGVDVIVGFPGETDGDFKITYEFLNQLDVSYFHVFTYSERDNTHATSLEGIVPITKRKERSKMLRILSEKKKRAFYETQIGKNRSILFEGKNDKGTIYGFTDNYVKVERTFEENLPNSIFSYGLLKVSESGSTVLV